MENKTFTIVPTQSNIEWVGKKVTGEHNGTIDIKKGSVTLNGDKITAGNFIIDTTSIKILDITDPTTNAQFLGHLISDDFFSTERYKEASVVITAVNDNHIDAELTIKDITHPISFDIVSHLNGDTFTATAKLLVDRTKYGMIFRSGSFFHNLGDNLIYNNFELNVNITCQS